MAKNAKIKIDNNLKLEVTQNDSFGDLVGIMQNPDEVMRKAGITIDVFDEMMSDTEILSAYQKRKRKLIVYKYKVISEDKGLEKYLNELINTLPIDKLINGLFKAVAYGYSVSELIWNKTDKGFIPVDIKNRSPKKFGFSDNGDLIYITQEGEKLAPYGKFVHYVNDLEDDNNPYGTALLSKCYWYWTFKKFGWKLWGYFLEKYGDPSLIYKTIETDTEKRDDFLNTLDNVRAGSNIVLGLDDEISALEVGSSANVDYQKYIREADKQIDKIFLGSTMLMEDTTHGTYNTANQHGTDLDDIVMSDSVGIAKAITRYLIDPIIAFNFGVEKLGKAEFILYKEDLNITPIDNNSYKNNNNSAKTQKNTQAYTNTHLSKKNENMSFYEKSYEELPKSKKQIEDILTLLEKEQISIFGKELKLDKLDNNSNKAYLELGDFINYLQDMLSNSIAKALFISYLYAKDEMKSYKDLGKYELFKKDLKLEGLLPFEEARKLFKDRIDLTDKEYKELTKEAKNWAFSFSGAKTKSIAKKIHKALLNDIKESKGEGAWKREVGDNLFKDLGVTPYNKGHIANIYRTNIFNEYSKAKYREYKKVEKYMPYLMYDAIGDNRTRPTHLALDGLVFKADDKIWDRIYPPNGYNCRCSVIPLTKEKAKKIGISKGKDYIDNPNYQSDKGWNFNAGKGIPPYIEQPKTTPISNQKTYKDYNLPKKYDIDMLKKVNYDIKEGKYRLNDQIIFTTTGDNVRIHNTNIYNYNDNVIKDVLLNPLEVWAILSENTYDNLDYLIAYITTLIDKNNNKIELGIVLDRLGQIIEITQDIEALRKGILLHFKKLDKE